MEICHPPFIPPSKGGKDFLSHLWERIKVRGIFVSKKERDFTMIFNALRSLRLCGELLQQENHFDI